ncbi:hypothetical protein [uncultured Brevundimonas sp.]|uniref:hypothetical protein n=1 Tax=uncultured Brevundimonas sp. TaxID=213418 RepID=UPI002635B4F7|nr:hypothetical protein [uncultured Brevundimonas sp.]
MTQASVKAARSLLTPTDHALILIDHQSQMAFPLNSIEVGALRANTATIARAAAAFAVPTILTSVAATSFSGPVFPEIQKAFPGAPIIDRTTMNCWEDAAVIAEVTRHPESSIGVTICVAMKATQTVPAASLSGRRPRAAHQPTLAAVRTQ